MKKVIYGKVYNTDTATAIHTHLGGQCGSMDRFEETLYLSPRGRFFLVGHGGAMSRYSRRYPDGTWGPGESMQVLPDDEALVWCERRNVDPDVIAKHFDIEEG